MADTYSQGLMITRTKEEILGIARKLGIKISSNSKKEHLAILIENAIIAHPQILTKALSYRDFCVYRILTTSNKEKDSFKVIELEVLIEFGLVNFIIAQGNKTPITVPQNTANAILPVIDEIINDPVVYDTYIKENVIIGISTLYGVLPAKKFAELFNKYQKDTFTEYELLRFIQERPRLEDNPCIDILGKKIFLSHIDSYDTEFLITEINSRNNLDYYEFDKNEILDAIREPYYAKNKQFAELELFLNKFDIEESEILFGDLWVSIQNEISPGKILSLVSEYVQLKGFADVQKAMEYIVSYSNSVPKWILKGHSSNELHNVAREDVVDNVLHRNFKVGRNDPCPCGSGKKYKHCCGNN